MNEPDIPTTERTCRDTFGGRSCEIVMCASADHGAVVAWALFVRPDGRLDPVYNERGTLVREYAETAAGAEAAVRQRLIALLGARRS